MKKFIVNSLLMSLMIFSVAVGFLIDNVNATCYGVLFHNSSSPLNITEDCSSTPDGFSYDSTTGILSVPSNINIGGNNLLPLSSGLVAGGGTVVSGDFSFTNFSGTPPTVNSVSGKDQAGSISLTFNANNPPAGAQITLTYHGGSMVNTPNAVWLSYSGPACPPINGNNYSGYSTTPFNPFTAFGTESYTSASSTQMIIHNMVSTNNPILNGGSVSGKTCVITWTIID